MNLKPRLVFEGAVERKMLDAYIKEIIPPPLHHGDIVVIDNLSAHKFQEAYETNRNCQATVLFLPAYSPDFKPIEKMWGKVKQRLQGIKPRIKEALLATTATALNAITADVA